MTEPTKAASGSPRVVRLHHGEKELLYELLNQHKVYQSFAEKLGFSKVQIRAFNNAEKWLDVWGRRQDATVGKLLKTASEIANAANVADYLEELINPK